MIQTRKGHGFLSLKKDVSNVVEKPAEKEVISVQKPIEIKKEMPLISAIEIEEILTEFEKDCYLERVAIMWSDNKDIEESKLRQLAYEDVIKQRQWERKATDPIEMFLLESLGAVEMCGNFEESKYNGNKNGDKRISNEYSEAS
jgi:hypothetical protein